MAQPPESVLFKDEYLMYDAEPEVTITYKEYTSSIIYNKMFLSKALAFACKGF